MRKARIVAYSLRVLRARAQQASLLNSYRDKPSSCLIGTLHTTRTLLDIPRCCSGAFGASSVRRTKLRWPKHSTRNSHRATGFEHLAHAVTRPPTCSYRDQLPPMGDSIPLAVTGVYHHSARQLTSLRRVRITRRYRVMPALENVGRALPRLVRDARNSAYECPTNSRQRKQLQLRWPTVRAASCRQSQRFTHRSSADGMTQLFASAGLCPSGAAI